MPNKVHTLSLPSLTEQESFSRFKRIFSGIMFRQRRISNASNTQESSTESSSRSPSVNSTESVASTTSLIFRTLGRNFFNSASQSIKITPLEQIDFSKEEYPFETINPFASLPLRMREIKIAKSMQKRHDIFSLLYILGGINHAILSFLNYVPASSLDDEVTYERNKIVIQHLRYALETFITTAQPRTLPLKETLNKKEIKTYVNEYLHYKEAVLQYYEYLKGELSIFCFSPQGTKSNILAELFGGFLDMHSSTYIYDQNNKNIEQIKLLEISDYMIEIRQKLTNQKELLISNLKNRGQSFFTFNGTQSTIIDLLEYIEKSLVNPKILKIQLNEALERLIKQSIEKLKTFINSPSEYQDSEKRNNCLMNSLVESNLSDLILIIGHHHTACKNNVDSAESFLIKLEQSYAFSNPAVMEFFKSPTPNKSKALISQLKGEISQTVEDSKNDDNEDKIAQWLEEAEKTYNNLFLNDIFNYDEISDVSSDTDEDSQTSVPSLSS